MPLPLSGLGAWGAIGPDLAVRGVGHAGACKGWAGGGTRGLAPLGGGWAWLYYRRGDNVGALGLLSHHFLGRHVYVCFVQNL